MIASGSVSPGVLVDVPVESTLGLLERARCGDPAALDALIAIYLPRLRRWATGRLPVWARDLSETQDLVQETVVQAFKHIERFEIRGEGALQAYLRQSLLNRIRMEIRRAGRRPQSGELDVETKAPGPSPLELAIGREALDRYETALSQLAAADREAIIARIELGLTYDEVATALGRPSPDAARKAVERALFRLAHAMRPT